MKKIFFATLSACVLLSSCHFKDEMTPVFTGKYDDPAEYQPVKMTANKTIKELSSLYTPEKPFKMNDDIVIAGKVISTDQPGNFYKSFYIQDETGGIEIKVGRNSLYSDYHEGQMIYVKCRGLWLGMYGYKSGNYGGMGMVQIGAEDPSKQYETSYLEAPVMIDDHIFCGEMGAPVAPVVISESDLPSEQQCQKDNKNVGRLVTLKGLTYTDGVFVLLYPDSNRPHTSSDPENRVFLTNEDNDTRQPILNSENWKITTWAMSKENIKAHLENGDWDHATVGSGKTTFGPITGEVSENGMFAAERRAAKKEKADSVFTYKTLLIKNAAAQSVSHYFKTDGGKEIQLRTSGFSKFADVQMPADVLNGSKKVNITGVLCMYQGSIQMTVNRVTDITYADGTPLN